MTRINAVNHKWWGIQKLSADGWQWASEYKFMHKSDADDLLNIMREGDTNYRVYEVVTEREQA